MWKSKSCACECAPDAHLKEVWLYHTDSDKVWDLHPCLHKKDELFYLASKGSKMLEMNKRTNRNIFIEKLFSMICGNHMHLKYHSINLCGESGSSRRLQITCEVLYQGKIYMKTLCKNVGGYFTCNNLDFLKRKRTTSTVPRFTLSY